MLTIEQKLKRAFWAIGVLAVTWALYAALFNSGAVSLPTKIAKVSNAEALLALASMIVALIVSMYQVQWRRVASSISSAQIVFRYFIAPVLVLVIPIRVLTKKFAAPSVEMPNGLSAILIVFLLIITWALVVFGLRVFETKTDPSYDERSSFQRNQERTNVSWFHVVVFAGATWALFL